MVSYVHFTSQLLIYIYVKFQEKWGRSFMFRVDNVVTRLVPSSGRLSVMNMASTQPEDTLAPQICSWSVSMSTTMRPPVGGLFLVQFSWIWSLAPWTVLELVHTARFSGLITLCLDSLVLETIGPRVTTLRVLSLLMLFLMLWEKRLRTVTVFKV